MALAAVELTSAVLLDTNSGADDQVPDDQIKGSYLAQTQADEKLYVVPKHYHRQPRTIRTVQHHLDGYGNIAGLHEVAPVGLPPVKTVISPP